jgi:hypothetical protein
MPKLNHPWRLAPTLDGVAINRGARFAAHLANLPPEERQAIERAERAYVNETRAPNSRHAAATQDFAESMQGLRDEDSSNNRSFKQQFEVP